MALTIYQAAKSTSWRYWRVACH